MIFYKTVSSGNDFIHIDMDEITAQGYTTADTDNMVRANLARRLCTRQTGIGADGVVFYKISGKTGADFEIFNRDGTEAELSGNGMAGLSALLFYLNKCHRRHDIVLNTKAGEKRIRYLHHEEKENTFRLKIEIGSADFLDNHLFPFLVSPSGTDENDNHNYNDIVFYPVSVGNPHAVVLLEADVPGEKLERMGKVLESAPIFPHKTNVEFVVGTGGAGGGPDYEKGKHFRIFYYERGVGRTLASSTGSAAVFAVLQKLKLIKDTLAIPGANAAGEKIIVSGKEKKEIYIENSTEIVYKGVYLLEPKS